MPYLPGHFHGFEALQLGRTVDYSSSLAACVTISDTMRDGSQRGGLQVDASLIPSTSIFGIRTLPSSSGQPRALAIAYIWGES